jgi:hypothetical protein
MTPTIIKPRIPNSPEPLEQTRGNQAQLGIECEIDECTVTQMLLTVGSTPNGLRGPVKGACRSNATTPRQTTAVDRSLRSMSWATHWKPEDPGPKASSMDRLEQESP